jgi:KDO2-lipid IV(A) lauroyltransferase
MGLSKKLKRDFQYALVRFLVGGMKLLSPGAGYSAACFLGGCAYVLIPKAREQVIRNLSLAFPEKGRGEVAILGRAFFRELGRNAWDALRMDAAGVSFLKENVRFSGLKLFDHAMKLKRGVVVVTGHIGCWELMPAAFAALGYPINVIGRRAYDDRLNEMLVGLRSRHGIRTIDRDAGAKEALRCLRRGEALGVLIDQDTRVKGVFVDFFGRPAYTPTGAVEFALRTGAALVPMAIHRNGDGKHTIEVLEYLPLPSTGNEEQDLTLHTQRCTEILEGFIRKHPDQWVWMHERWRTKPNHEKSHG